MRRPGPLDAIKLVVEQRLVTATYLSGHKKIVDAWTAEGGGVIRAWCTRVRGVISRYTIQAL